MQGSRKCRAKIITDLINGQTTIVNVKGSHNHEVNIKRSKPLPHMIRQRQYGPSRMSDMKVELLNEQYQGNTYTPNEKMFDGQGSRAWKCSMYYKLKCRKF